MDSWISRTWHNVIPHITVHRTVDHLKVFFDINDNVDDLTRPSFLRREPMVQWICNSIAGNYWDVGCNVGQFAIPAAALGHRVVAFDISPRACRLLQLSAKANDLPITVVDRALSVLPFSYAPPTTSRPSEHVSPTVPALSSKTSIAIHEALATYGRPTLVKMDIEGAECEFIKSPAWKSLLTTHGIYWLLEIHPPRVDTNMLWRDMPFLTLDEDHYLFHPSPSVLSALRAAWNVAEPYTPERAECISECIS